MPRVKLPRSPAYLGKSSAGFRSKKSNGRNSKLCHSTGITGQSSARTICCIPMVYQSTRSVFSSDRFLLVQADYLLKPVMRSRLQETLQRASERLEQAASLESEIERVRRVAENYEAEKQPLLERIPIRRREDIILLPIGQVAAITAEGELLHITTERKETYTLSYRLKDLEARLDPTKFVRLGRGTLANLEMITVISQLPGGTYTVTLSNGQQLSVSRLQSRLLRERLLRL
jgi:two-component system, LytTR family, response regulator